jgi:phosphate starvation-inducible protein PhoH
MARASNKSTLTTSGKPQVERQARRINRQQKQLDRVMVNDMYSQSNVSLSNSRGRAIKLANLKKVEPLTDTQHDFFDAYADNEEAFVLYGSAGTGKSFLALYHALAEILEPESDFEKIVIVRSSVQGREQGHLPGSVDEKMEAFELPYIAICAELLGRSDAYEKLKDLGKIEFISTSFLRGTTFNNCIIIADEIQNETFSTIGTLVTRTGKNSKLIIMGDGVQNDLQHSKHDVSGFREFIAVTKNMVEFRHFKFTSDDIVRSGICKSWIVECEKLGL